MKNEKKKEEEEEEEEKKKKKKKIAKYNFFRLKTGSQQEKINNTTQ